MVKKQDPVLDAIRQMPPSDLSSILRSSNDDALAAVAPFMSDDALLEAYCNWRTPSEETAPAPKKRGGRPKGSKNKRVTASDDADAASDTKSNGVAASEGAPTQIVDELLPDPFADDGSTQDDNAKLVVTLVSKKDGQFTKKELAEELAAIGLDGIESATDAAKLCKQVTLDGYLRVSSKGDGDREMRLFLSEKGKELLPKHA